MLEVKSEVTFKHDKIMLKATVPEASVLSPQNMNEACYVDFICSTIKLSDNQKKIKVGYDIPGQFHYALQNTTLDKIKQQPHTGMLEIPPDFDIKSNKSYYLTLCVRKVNGDKHTTLDYAESVSITAQQLIVHKKAEEFKQQDEIQKNKLPKAQKLDLLLQNLKTKINTLTNQFNNYYKGKISNDCPERTYIAILKLMGKSNEEIIMPLRV